VWNLTIVNARGSKVPGVLKEWQLILYGAEEEPIRLKPADEAQFGSTSSAHAAVSSRSDKSASGLYCSRQCVDHCQSQPAGSDCKQCREQYKSYCARNCEPGTFFSAESGCQACHSSCGSCFGGQQNQCLDCATHYYLITDLSVCVASCPDGYFSVNQTCAACGPHCTACVGSSNHCLSCASHLILYQTRCVASCPAGTYEVNQRCETCAPGCETCVGPSDTNCVLCAAGLAHDRGRCVTSCPEGSFLDARRGECSGCGLGCARCGSLELCDQCGDGWLAAEDGTCRPANQADCAAAATGAVAAVLVPCTWSVPAVNPTPTCITACATAPALRARPLSRVFAGPVSTPVRTAGVRSSAAPVSRDSCCTTAPAWPHARTAPTSLWRSVSPAPPPASPASDRARMSASPVTPTGSWSRAAVTGSVQSDTTRHRQDVGGATAPAAPATVAS